MITDLRPTRFSQQRRGTVLIIALWVIVVLVSVVLVFARNMRVEAAASANELGAAQAAAIERGAEQYVLALLDQEKDQVMQESQSMFQAVPVGDGCFWIIRPNYDDPQMPCFGFVDEASKINLNSATSSLYMLPGVPADMPPAIIDWRDADSSPLSGGAESDYYLGLPHPYFCKNAPLETVEEVLLIRGASPELLYGQTAAGMPNRVPPWTTDVTRRVEADPVVIHGLFDYLTVYSVEPNKSASGASRININDGNIQSLSKLLHDTFGSTRAHAILAKARPTPPFRDIFDFSIRTTLTSQEFQTIADRLATTTQKNLVGRINVNTASREVLLCLPGLTDAEVSSLIAARQNSATQRMGIAWVADALGKKAVGLGNAITGRSLQYSADIVAVESRGRGWKRCRIVVDARFTPPRIVYRKDLTEAGWPMAPEILASLRAGGVLPRATDMQTRSVQP